MRDASSPVIYDRLSRCCQIWQMKIIDQIVFSDFFLTQCLYEIAFSLPSLLAFSLFSNIFGVKNLINLVSESLSNGSEKWWESLSSSQTPHSMEVSQLSSSSKSKNKIKFHHYFFVYSFNFSILESRRGYFSLASFCSLKKKQ